MIRKPAAILLVLSVAVLALALVPAAGFAAKGGNGGNQGGGGKPGGGGGATSATVTASPNPAAAWGAHVELTGCGYDMYQPAELHVVHPSGYTEAMMIVVWNPGCLNATTIVTAEPGTYRLEMYQNSKRSKVLVASTDLVVV